MSSLKKEPQSDTILLLISNYTRTYYENLNHVYIPLSLKHLMVKFTKKTFHDSQLLSLSNDIHITNKLHQLNIMINSSRPSLLFRASEHSFSIPDCYNICEDISPTTLFVKCENYSQIIGAYIDVTWDMKRRIDRTRIGEYNNKSFIFCLNTECRTWNYKGLDSIYPTEREFVCRPDWKVIIFGWDLIIEKNKIAIQASSYWTDEDLKSVFGDDYNSNKDIKIEEFEIFKLS